MIKANHSKFHHWLMDTYIRYILKSDFRNIIITGNFETDNRSILLIPNHFSWWDGFFAWHLNETLLKKRFHVMMLESELSKRMFFSRIGAFSVNINSRSLVESLNYCSDLLKDPNNLVIIYPQGKLGSQHIYETEFKKGVEKILANSVNPRVLFSIFLTDYYGFRRPTLTIALKEYLSENTILQIEKEFNLHLKESINNQDNLFET